MNTDLLNIAKQFVLDGKPVSIVPLGDGLINDTYKVFLQNDAKPRYVLQRINTVVFPDVEMLQSNIVKVTSHIRNKLLSQGEKDIDRKVLLFLPTFDGAYFFYDGKNYWRVMVFIPESFTYQVVTPQYSQFAGEAFGNFQFLLSDLHEHIGEVIPDFHNVEFRLQQLAEAVKTDKIGRVSETQSLLKAIEQQRTSMCFAEQLYREGKLPKRICHCDTKVNNMLFDAQGKVLCVIDLDTVMPSFVFSDFGDFLRSAANTGAEDDPDLNNVTFNMEIFKAFTQGYLKASKPFLLPIERENLSQAALLFPYMQCVRFLADYLNGDVYYKIKYATHNLVRAKAQWKLFESALSHVDEMKCFIDSCK